MKFTPLTLDHLTPWADLLAIAFARQPSQMRQLLHFLQPETNLLAWGAWDGERLVAQYSCLLRQLTLPGHAPDLAVGLSVNMAVHPAYRGRGLVKQVAQPVYATLAQRQVAAGVGFSNAAGVQVDKRSSGYGYQVVGPLRPYLLWLRAQPGLADFALTADWPEQPFAALGEGTAVQFAWTPATLQHRFASHPFRNYQFGVWRQNGVVVGVVVYRPIRLAGVPAVGLLGAYGRDQANLLRHWAGAVQKAGYRLAHLVCPANSAPLALLSGTAVCLPQPISRNPYYLTLKPLCSTLPETVFHLENWVCWGGDIL
ncbi:MAG: GNAT family N-acetyltransferase [Anaerolineales bacterium]|nr:GNAT family N-acetyltransferase [Anaerolineales bacterium]